VSDEEHEAELSGELDEGGKAALALVEHLIRMGAGNCTIPIIIADELYEVTVQHKPVQPEGAS
jgi:hypothetical protein